MNNMGATCARLMADHRFVPRDAASKRAMTLVEVLVAIAVFGLVFGSVMTGLTRAHYRAAWCAYNTSATKLAEERMEQLLNARWDVSTSTNIDQVTTANFPTDSPVLDAYTTNGVNVSRSVTITNIPSSASPQYKGLSARVIWSLRGRGPFTNSVFSLRAPDQ